MWGQSLQTVTDKISILQKKAIRIMTFSDPRANSQPLFKEQKILKVEDNIFLQNCLFVFDYFKGNLPKSFNNIFTKTENIHSIFTRNANKGIVVPNMFNTTTYGLKSIYIIYVLKHGIN